MQHPLIALTLTAPLWGAGATLAQNLATDISAVSAAQTLTQSEAKPEAETAPATQRATHPAIHTSGMLQGWQLGGVVSHGRYREPGLMQLQGPRLGVWAAKSLPAQGHWQPTLQGQLQSSAMQYSSPISGELANVPDHELDLRLTALHPLIPSFASPWGPLQLGAYAGLGYRLHYNDLRGTTTQGYIGYRRLNQRLYLPLGLQLQTPALNPVTLSIEYAPALYGSHTTYMTDVGGTKDATEPQKSQGWSLQASWQLQPSWHLSAYHRQWTTKATTSWQSTINGVTKSYVEPASEWQETGLQLSRQF
jgi:hypothetical protein